MKKRFAILIFLLMSAGYSFSQKGVKIGVTLMPLFSKASTLDTIPRTFSYRMKFGFGGGVNVLLGFAEKQGITTGFYFIQKGFRVYNDSQKQIKNTFSNLEIPLGYTIRQTLSSSSFVRETFGAAVNFSLNKKTNEEFSNEKRSFRIIQEEKIKVYPMLYLGFEFGTQMHNGNMLFIGINYKQPFQSTSLLHVYNTSQNKPRLFDLGYRGSYIGIQVSYLFNLSNLKKPEEFFY
ncbi:MAG: outer membrane beta-barrel protein [Bacteroidia bacterium]|nr:outer membrane beta-barrel protein [Bacteroidia bacterium]